MNKQAQIYVCTDLNIINSHTFQILWQYKADAFQCYVHLRLFPDSSTQSSQYPEVLCTLKTVKTKYF